MFSKFAVILNDFGDSAYNGVLQGVIYNINPDIKIISLNKSIQSQNIIQGAWQLLESFSFFPHKTIFLCVIDPGVGTDRKIIAVESENYIFIGPDNGILYSAALKDGIREIYEIPVNENISSTFHGRDVMAVATGKISLHGFSGLRKIDRMIELSVKPEFSKGKIVNIDPFGNIITNIQMIRPEPGVPCNVVIQNKRLEFPFSRTYEEMTENTLTIIKGSSSTLEFSVKNSSAYEFMIKNYEIYIGMDIEIN